MSVTIKLRKGLASEWASNDTVVLASGEPGFELDTGRLKIGDGTSTWTNLDYVSIVPTGFSAGTGIGIHLGSNGSSVTISVSGLINNPTSNRILTSRDNTNTGIDAESNLTFDGSTLSIIGSVTANSFVKNLGVGQLSTDLLQAGGGVVPAGSLSVSYAGSAGNADQVGHTLTRGSYLTGNNFNGSASTTWAVDATTSATASKVVARDANGHDYRVYGFAQYFNMSHNVSTRNSDTIFYSSTDAYIRKNNVSGMRSSLDVPTRTGGDASGTWGIDITGNAATVTNGVYTTGNQSVGGVKTFTDQIINTKSSSTITGGGQIYLNGNTGNRIDFNINGLGGPSIYTRSIGTKINLYPSLSTGSATDFAIGLANDGAGGPTRFWQSVNNSSSRFEWYAAGTTLATLTGSGVLTVAGNTSQINVDNIRLDGNTVKATNSNGSLNLFSNNNLGSINLGPGSEEICIKSSNSAPIIEMWDNSVGPDLMIEFNASTVAGESIFYNSPEGGGGELLYIDPINSAIGINTGSPSYSLDVVGNINASRYIRATKFTEKNTSPTISSNTLTLNLDNGSIFLVTLNANITTLTISNPTSFSNNTSAFSIIFTADGTARSITWPASVKWPGNVSPTLTSTNGKKDIFSFVTPDQGTTWFGFVGGQNY